MVEGQHDRIVEDQALRLTVELSPSGGVRLAGGTVEQRIRMRVGVVDVVLRAVAPKQLLAEALRIGKVGQPREDERRVLTLIKHGQQVVPGYGDNIDRYPQVTLVHVAQD